MSIEIRGFTIHIDPTGEWLEVDLNDLSLCGFSPFDFSESSKRDGERFFLSDEEDCDLYIGIYHDRVADYKPMFYSTVEYESPCFIRDLKSIQISDA